MKQYWQSVVLKIDALSLRERAMIFAMVAADFGRDCEYLVLDPQFAKAKQLSNQMKQELRFIFAQAEIQQKLKAAGN